MTDKEKLNAIKAEVQNYIDAAHKAHTNITEGNFAHLLSFINSLQEEPVRRTPADIESVMQEIEEKSKAFTEAHKGEDADTILAQMRGEEPVSEELEEAALLHLSKYYDTSIIWDEDKKCVVRDFKAGAKWQKERDENEIRIIRELLDNFDKTCDEYHDAGFKHGQEALMKDATEVPVHIDAGGYPYIPEIELYDYDKDVPLAKDGDKYKVVLIKEE